MRKREPLVILAVLAVIAGLLLWLAKSSPRRAELDASAGVLPVSANSVRASGPKASGTTLAPPTVARGLLEPAQAA